MLSVRKSVEIPEGILEGQITGRQVRPTTIKDAAGHAKQVEYLDLFVTNVHDARGLPVGGEDFELKVGYALPITSLGKGGQMLARFGASIERDGDLDVDAVLLGRTVKFRTVRNGDGFVNIDRDSLIPTSPRVASGPVAVERVEDDVADSEELEAARASREASHERPGERRGIFGGVFNRGA